jgi:hypothetical protein
MDQNRKFAEMNNLCWHTYEISKLGFWECRCGCGHKTYCEIDHIKNPDFSDPREVLRVVMATEDWWKFQSTLFYPPDRIHDAIIPIIYITTPGKLRDAWIEWMEQTKGGIHEQ